ncbi:MAG: queuosine precursor transporter [Gammaproteobacteria bacterium]|nr:queuosine precursor transporter [Gammaproteobacteria bacterium]
MITNFGLTLLAFRLWGKVGLFVFAIISIILTNIQALKQVELFGLNGSMSDISYVSVYLISDILSENYGKETAKKIVGLGMFSMMVVSIIMYISLLFIPNAYDETQQALSVYFFCISSLINRERMCFFYFATL